MTNLQSSVTEAVVYADRARLTRSASLELEAGEHLLVFDNLPEALDPESLQVNASGPLLLFEVNFRELWKAPQASPQAQQMAERKKALEQSIQALDDALEVLEQRAAFAKALASFDRASDKSDARRFEMDVQKWEQMLAFSTQVLEGYFSQKRAREAEKEALAKELEELRHALASIAPGKGVRTRAASLRCQAQVAGEFVVQLLYVVKGPSWSPTYDLRVDSETRKLTLEYNALVRQKTGEDWDQAHLLLSTARPNISGVAPKLSPWLVGFHVPMPAYEREEFRAKRAMRPRPGTSPMASGFTAPSFDEEVDEDGLMPQPEPAPAPTTDLHTKTSSVVIGLQGRTPIPSSADAHRVSILRAEFELEFRHASLPKLSDFCYLKARATNQTEYPLLPGNSNIYFDGDFVAKSRVELVAPGETFWTSLGIDEGVKVERKPIKRFESQEGLLSKRTRLVFQFVFEVSNLKKTPVVLSLHDQLPKPQHEDIHVELLEPKVKTNSKALRVDDDKHIRWLFELEPGQKKQIPLEFWVEYPKDKTINGL